MIHNTFIQDSPMTDFCECDFCFWGLDVLCVEDKITH